MPYTFLGTGNYEERDENKLININMLWELDSPTPAKLLKMTDKLVVG